MIEWLRQTGVVAIMECRLQAVSASWRVAVALSALLAVISTIAGVEAFERQQSELNLLETRRSEATQDGQHIVSGFQRDEALRIVRPLAPGGILVRTLEYALYQDPGPEGLTAGRVTPHQTTAITDGLGLDLEFILRGLVGLLAVVVGTSSLVVARYRGITKALVSLPVSASALVAGAQVGGLAAIALAAGITIGAAVGLLGIYAPLMLTTSLGVTATLLWLAAVIFGAAVQGLGTIAALWSRTAAGTLSLAVAAWLIATMVAIPVVSAAASSLAPVGPRSLFEAERLNTHRAAIAGIELAAGELVVRGLGREPIRPDVQLDRRLTSEVDGLWNVEIPRLRATLESMEAARREAEVRQTHWIEWLSLPLPGALFRSAATELAGVGKGSAVQWEENVQEYQDALNAAVFDRRPRTNFRVRRDGGAYWIYVHDRAPMPSVSDLPQFAAQKTAISTHARNAALSLALLGLHSVITWMIAVLTFVRRQATHGDWN